MKQLMALQFYLVLSIGTPAHAIVIEVSDSNGLKQALIDANDGDIIELANGTYPVPGEAFAINATSQIAGRSLTIRAALGATVVLDGASSNDVFRVINESFALGAPLRFENLTFANGVSETLGFLGASPC